MQKKWFILLSLILVIVGFVLLMHSSYFGVKTILVDGNLQLQDAQIIKASGIQEGQNMFLLPGREIANQLMNDVRIKGVKLERQFPNTLSIIINERSGLGLFPLKGGKWLEVSEDGIILATYTQSQPKPQMPLIEGVQLTVVDKQIQDSDKLTDVLLLLHGLLPWQKQITEVCYQADDIKVVFKSGIIVYFGHNSDLKRNIPVFTTIVNNLKETGKENQIEYLDLRFDGKPVIREKS